MKDKAANSKQEDKNPGCLLNLGNHEAKTPANSQRWTTGVCPQCGFTGAAVDPDAVLWCPACGYSKKGVFT